MALRQQWCYTSNGATPAMVLPTRWRYARNGVMNTLKRKFVSFVTLPEVIITVQQSVLNFQNQLKSDDSPVKNGATPAMAL